MPLLIVRTILRAACFAALVLWPGGAAAQAVPDHLISLTKSLLSGIEGEDFDRYDGTPLEQEVIEALRETRLKGWRGAPAQVKVDPTKLAATLGLDPANPEDKASLDSILAATTREARIEAIGKALAAKSSDFTSGDIRAALARFETELGEQVGDLETGHTFELEDGREVEVKWNPATSDMIVTVDHGDGRGSTVLHGGTPASIDETGNLSWAETQPDDEPVTYLSPEFEAAIAKMVFGIWRNGDDVWMIRPPDGDLPEPNGLDPPRKATEERALRDRIAEMQQRKVYVWRAPGGGRVIQDSYRDLRGQGYEYLRDESGDYFADQIADLRKRLEELEQEQSRDWYSQHDPLDLAGQSGQSSTPIRMTTIRGSGVRVDWDRASFDGKRVSGFRIVTDIREINKELPGSIQRELVNSWSPPNWVELKTVYNVRDKSVQLEGLDWWLHVTWNRMFQSVSYIDNPYSSGLTLTRKAGGTEEDNEKAVVLRLLSAETKEPVDVIEHDKAVILEAEYLTSHEVPEAARLIVDDGKVAAAAAKAAGEQLPDQQGREIFLAAVRGEDGQYDPHVFQSRPFYLRSVQFRERTLGKGLYTDDRYYPDYSLEQYHDQWERETEETKRLIQRHFTGEWQVAQKQDFRGDQQMLGRASVAEDGSTARLALVGEDGYLRYESLEMKAINGGDAITIRFSRVNSFRNREGESPGLEPLPEATLIDVPTLARKAEFRLNDERMIAGIRMEPAPEEVINVRLNKQSDDRYSASFLTEFTLEEGEQPSGRQTWSRKPEIRRALPIMDQTKQDEPTRAYYPYKRPQPPGGARPSSVFDATGAADWDHQRRVSRNNWNTATQRTLFVYGKNLPTTRIDAYVIESQTEGLTYEYRVLEDMGPEAVQRGWEAAKRVDKAFTSPQDYDAFFLIAKFDDTVPPGTHDLFINGAPLRWYLTFADARAKFYFIDVPPPGGTPTDIAFKGDVLFLEMELDADLPVEDDLILNLNIREHTEAWADQEALSETIEVKMARVSAAEAGMEGRTMYRPLYRSPPIHIYDKDDPSTKPPAVPGAILVPLGQPEPEKTQDKPDENSAEQDDGVRREIVEVDPDRAEEFEADEAARRKEIIKRRLEAERERNNRKVETADKAKTVQPPDLGPASKLEKAPKSIYDDNPEDGFKSKKVATLFATWTRPDLLRVPLPASAIVFDSPADLATEDGEETTWTRALTRARNCYDSDGPRILSSNADEYSKFIITEVFSMANLERAAKRQQERLRNAENIDDVAQATVPIYNTLSLLYEAGKRSIPISLGDHAAALLVRDQYLRAAAVAKKKYETLSFFVKDEFIDAALLHGDRADPIFGTVRVEVGGDDVLLGELLWSARPVHKDGRISLRDDPQDIQFLKEKYPEAAELGPRAFLRKYISVAAKKYAKAVAGSAEKTRRAGDCAVDHLLVISTRGNPELVKAILPRLVRPVAEGNSVIWEPDLTAQAYVKTLPNLRAATQALDNYASLDKAVVALSLAGAGGFAAGVLSQFGALSAAAYTTLAVDVLDVAIFGTIGAYEYAEKHGYLDMAGDLYGFATSLGDEEFDDVYGATEYALGASAILGTDIYDEALQGEPSTFWTMAGVALPGVGVLGSLGDLKHLRHIEKGREIAAGLGDISTSAVRALSKEDYGAFMAYTRAMKDLRYLENRPGVWGFLGRKFRLNRVYLSEADKAFLGRFDSFSKARRIEIDDGFDVARRLDRMDTEEVLSLNDAQRRALATFIEDVEVRLTSFEENIGGQRIAILTARERVLAQRFGKRMAEIEAEAQRLRRAIALREIEDAKEAARAARRGPQPATEDAGRGLRDRGSDEAADAGDAARPVDEAADAGDAARPADEAADAGDAARPADEAADAGDAARPADEAADAGDAARPADEAADAGDAARPADEAADAGDAARPADEAADAGDAARPADEAADAGDAARPADEAADAGDAARPADEAADAGDAARPADASAPRPADEWSDYANRAELEDDLPTNIDPPKIQPARSAEAAPVPEPEPIPVEPPFPPIKEVSDVRQGGAISMVDDAGRSRGTFELGEQLGFGATHTVFDLPDMPGWVARIASSDAYNKGKAYDDFARRALDSFEDPDVSVAELRGRFYVRSAFGKHVVEIIRRADETARDQILRNIDGTFTPGQAEAMDKATRALNKRGLFWADNHHRNYRFVETGEPDKWTVEIIDPGGIFKMVDDPPGTAAAKARAAQEDLGRPRPDMVRDLREAEAISEGRAKLVREGNSVEIRDEIIENHGKNFDFEGMLGAGHPHIGDWGQVPFRGDGTLQFPKYGQLSQFGDADAAAAARRLRDDPLAAVNVPLDRVDVLRDTLRAGGYDGLDDLAPEDLSAVQSAMQRVADKVKKTKGANALSEQEEAMRQIANRMVTRAAEVDAQYRARGQPDSLPPRTPLNMQTRGQQIAETLADAARRADAAQFRSNLARIADPELAPKALTKALDDTASDLAFRRKVMEQLAEAQKAFDDAEIRLAELRGDHKSARNLINLIQPSEPDAAQKLAAAEEDLRAIEGRILNTLESVAPQRRMLEKTTEADLDWLSGTRPRLSLAEMEAAQAALTRNDGLWAKMLKDPTMSPGEVHRMSAWRKGVVDEMLATEIAAIEAKTGRKIDPLAFGSNNLTSDYDLSIKVPEGEPGAAEIIRNFNSKFRTRFGREPGLVFDTNVYSEPAYTFVGSSARRGGLNPVQADAVRQRMYSETAMRRYSTDTEWADHKADLLRGTTPDEADALNYIFKQVEANYDAIGQGIRRAQSKVAGDPARLQQMEAEFDALSKAKKAGDLDADGLKRLSKLETDLEQVRLQAANETYANLLGSVEAFTSEFNRLSRLSLKDSSALEALDEIPQLARVPGEAGRLNAYGESLNALKKTLLRAEQARAAGKPDDAFIEQATELHAAMVDTLAAQVRNRQGQALFFASEAYQTDGAIAHVVGELQAGGRKVTAKTLKTPARGGGLKPSQYFDSLTENRANMFKEVDHARSPVTRAFKDPRKAAAKASKYMIRQLDAGHQGGLDLSEIVDPRLIDATVAVEANRGDLDAVARVLDRLDLSAEQFVDIATSGSTALSKGAFRQSVLSRNAEDIAKWVRQGEADLSAALADLERSSQKLDIRRSPEATRRAVEAAVLQRQLDTQGLKSFADFTPDQARTYASAVEDARTRAARGGVLNSAENKLLETADFLSRGARKADSAWRAAQPANPPRDLTLRPGQGVSESQKALAEVTARLEAARVNARLAGSVTEEARAARAQFLETVSDLEFRQKVLSDIADQLKAEADAAEATKQADEALKAARAKGDAEEIEQALRAVEEAEAAETRLLTGSRPVNYADIEWLSGSRGRLSAVEEAEAAATLKRYGNRWQKMLKDPNLGASEIHRLTAWRKATVDDMLDAIRTDVAKRTGRKPERLAFGSNNLTSDYDLSIKIAEGPGSAEVVRRFNAEFRNRFGAESGMVFDTNVYTEPSYSFVSSADTARRGRIDVPPAEADRLRQAVFRETKIRRFADDTAWQKHRDVTLRGLSADERRAFEYVLDEAENNVARARKNIEAGSREAANRNKLDFDALQSELEAAKAAGDQRSAANLQDVLENLELEAANEKYADLLEEIDGAMEALNRLQDPSLLDDPAVLRGLSNGIDGLTPTARAALDEKLADASDLVSKAQQLEAAGGSANQTAALIARAEAEVALDEAASALARQARNLQGEALYFASEAYFTQGAIAHVVGELQAGGRKITAKSLRSPPVESGTSKGEYLDSFYENRGDTLKEISHLTDEAGNFTQPDKAAAKVSKYFIRQLDAAHQAGLDLSNLSPENLIEATVKVNEVRGDYDKVVQELAKFNMTPKQFADAALAASDDLTGQAVQASVVRSEATRVAEDIDPRRVYELEPLE